MHRFLRAGCTISVVALLVAAGFGIAVATTPHPEAYGACSTSSGALGLLKSGKCTRGSHKITISAQAAPLAGASTGPGQWVKLSSGPSVQNIADPSVHRFGSHLQVVWIQPRSGGGATLHTRILAADGAPASKDETLLHWQTLNEYPVITSNGSQRLIAFSGLDTTSGSAYAGGYGYYLTSSDGTRWTLAHATLGSNTSLYNSQGTDVTDAAGTPVIAYTSGTAGNVIYHKGFDTLPPAKVNPDPTTTSGPCCTYYAGIGYEAKTSQTWTAWYSNSGKATTDGIDAQRLYPSAGAQVHAPSSTTSYHGQIGSVSPGQRVQVAERSGGGLYAAYLVGYPSPTRIALWRLGSRKPLLHASGPSAGFPGVAAAPGGRLWLYWYDRQGTRLYAARTNSAGTRLGATCSVRPPRGTTDVWNTTGNSDSGTLDLIVNATVGHSEQLFATQVLPCLSGRISPSAVTHTRGGRITVTVVDAGDPVAGAEVHYDGTTKQTNAHGQVVLRVAKGAAKGERKVTFGDSGYTGGALHFHVS